MDPKELKITNICFSFDDGKSEESKNTKNKGLNDFDDTETYSLFNTIAKFTLPRLKRFKEVTDSHPTDMTFEEWMIILDKIIESLEIISKDDFSFSHEKEAKIKEGTDLFGKYFTYLWW